MEVYHPKGSDLLKTTHKLVDVYIVAINEELSLLHRLDTQYYKELDGNSLGNYILTSVIDPGYKPFAYAVDRFNDDHRMMLQPTRAMQRDYGSAIYMIEANMNKSIYKLCDRDNLFLFNMGGVFPDDSVLLYLEPVFEYKIMVGMVYEQHS